MHACPQNKRKYMYRKNACRDAIKKYTSKWESTRLARHWYIYANHYFVMKLTPIYDPSSRYAHSSWTIISAYWYGLHTLTIFHTQISFLWNRSRNCKEVCLIYLVHKNKSVPKTSLKPWIYLNQTESHKLYYSLSKKLSNMQIKNLNRNKTTLRLELHWELNKTGSEEAQTKLPRGRPACDWDGVIYVPPGGASAAASVQVLASRGISPSIRILKRIPSILSVSSVISYCSSVSQF